VRACGRAGAAPHSNQPSRLRDAAVNGTIVAASFVAARLRSGASGRFSLWPVTEVLRRVEETYFVLTAYFLLLFVTFCAYR
jgi:hypothetical protein